MKFSSQITLTRLFGAPDEKHIWDLCEASNGSFILLQHEAFGERYRPGGHLFDLCSRGRLLIISFGLLNGTPLTKEICRGMNRLVEKLCGK